MSWIKKQWQDFKCFWGYHIKGEYSRTTNRMFHIRHKYWCAHCKLEYNEEVILSRFWGG